MQNVFNLRIFANALAALVKQNMDRKVGKGHFATKKNLPPSGQTTVGATTNTAGHIFE